MASSRPSSHTVDTTDVAATWKAFENINKVFVTISISMAVRKQVPEPCLSGVAINLKPMSGEVSGWDFLSARCWAMEHKNLDTAVFQLLYTLDGLIAKAEIGSVLKKEA